jgi:hypothetical protein
MKRIPALILIVLALTSRVAPAQTPASKDRSRLGVNVVRVRDWSPSFMFIDVMKSARRFASPEKPWEGEAPLDDKGWPTADAGVIAFTEAVNVNGVYKLSCTGKATVKVVRSPAEVKDLAYDEGTNRTTCQIVFDAPADEVTRLFLAFTDTQGGVRDVKLLRPGYDDDQQVFTTEFLRSLEPFGFLRCMDLLKTNDCPFIKWSDRVTPDRASYADGAPYEIAIDLANALHKDVWLHVPVAADDEFVHQLAALVKSRLAPDVNCYVEWSNEVWNGIFDQQKVNDRAARDDVAHGDRTLSLRGLDDNARRWAWRRTARRTAEISRIFRDVFGKDDHRIRMVLAGQHANPEILDVGLKYIETNVGKPSDVLYGIAIAPYFGNDDKAALKRNDLTVDDVCKLLIDQADESADARAKGAHALAKRHGLKSIAYEGGIDLGQYDASLDAKTRAQFDPRAGEAVEKHLRAWFAGGGNEYAYFSHVSRYTKSGYWGLTADVRKLDVPKMQAAVRVAHSTR